MALVLYPFLLRDAITGKWYRARWKATSTVDSIAEFAVAEQGGGKYPAYLVPYFLLGF